MNTLPILGSKLKKTAPLALITGGARGIGFGISLALAQEGFDLCLCGLRAAKDVTEALKILKSTGRDILYVQANVAKAADRKRLLATVRKRFNRLNVLVNNAGIAPRQRRDILEATEESYDEVLNTNLKGPYFLTQAAARWMVEQKKTQPEAEACIINVSSISAAVASPNRGEYCISKAGVSMATQLWAVRLAEFSIRVYEVRPGLIKTDMTAAVEAKYDKLIAEGLLLQPRWGLPSDVGRAVAMMARGDIAYSTGQVLMVDGGQTIQRL